MQSKSCPSDGSRKFTSDLPVLSGGVPNQVIRADDLAWAMVDVAASGRGEHRSLVLGNRDIRAMVKSHNVLTGIRMASV